MFRTVGLGHVLATLGEFIDEDKLPSLLEEEDDAGALDSGHVCNLIKDNEIDHLRELLTNATVSLAKLRWSENEEQVMNGVKVNELTPLELAVKSKSLACLKLIVEKYSSKEQYQYGDIEVDGKTYSTLLLPLLLQTKDLEALNYLAKQPSFSLKTKDVLNFIEQAIKDKWAQGAKALLASVPAFLAYQA